MWLFLTFYDQQHFLTTILQKQMNLFCVICRKKKREYLKAWQAASSTPCSRGECGHWKEEFFTGQW